MKDEDLWLLGGAASSVIDLLEQTKREDPNLWSRTLERLSLVIEKIFPEVKSAAAAPLFDEDNKYISQDIYEKSERKEATSTLIAYIQVRNEVMNLRMLASQRPDPKNINRAIRFCELLRSAVVDLLDKQRTHESKAPTTK